MTLDADGEVAGEMRYYPFGEVRTSSGSMWTDQLFTGQRAMLDLGIYHYNARFYSPALGRFLSADTVVPGAAQSQAYDRYAYVTNSPLVYSDPSGHWPDWVDPEGWFDYAMGAESQFVDDLTFGLVSALTGDMDNNLNADYQQGREAGRVASTIVASVETVLGIYAVVAGLGSVGPTSGGGLLAALPSGGTSVLVAGVAVPVELAIAGMGVVAAGHGMGTIAYIRGNPLDNPKTPSIEDLLNDPNAFSGWKQSEIEALIPNNWVKSPLRKGEGVRYLKPTRKGQAIMIEQGWPNASDLLHSGPYLRVSSGKGTAVRVPLAGNPLLK